MPTPTTATADHAVFASSVRATARTLERQVEAQCASPTATEPTLTYVDSILQWRSRGLVADSSQCGVGLPVAAVRLQRLHAGHTIGALGKQGAIAICDDRVPNTANPQYACPIVRASAGTSGPAFFDGRLFNQRYLVTIAPGVVRPGGERDQPARLRQCVEVSVDPKPTKSFTFAPGVRPAGIVQTCIAEGAPHYLLPTTASGARVARMAQKSATDPMCACVTWAPQLFDPCSPATMPWSWPARRPPRAGGRGSPASRRPRAARLDLFAPRVAYAGTAGSARSPPSLMMRSACSAPVDQYTFFGDFEQDVVGQAPVAPRATLAARPLDDRHAQPGAVTVQPSLGDIASKLLVINQGGGNAQQKDGVEVTALLDPTPKPAPPYRSRGRTPSVCGGRRRRRAPSAPFILQSSRRRARAVHPHRRLERAARPITFTAGGSASSRRVAAELSQTIQFTVDFATRTVACRPARGADGGAALRATDLAQARWSITGATARSSGWTTCVHPAQSTFPRP
jgi:hypothetical protein